MEVLITGGLGYVGSAVAVELREAGHDVTVLDDKSTSKVDRIDGVKEWAFDVRSPGVVNHLVRDADVVAHLAALSGIETCRTNPGTAADVNVVGTFNVVRACAMLDVPLIFASSFAVYDDLGVIDGERGPREAPTFYGQTKRAGEDIVTAMADAHTPAIIFQMGNLYGEHEVDGITVSKPTAVNTFIECARAGEPPTVHLPGVQTRDFVHVADVARAYRLATEAIREWYPDAHTYPLATGNLTLVEEVAHWAADEVGISPEYVEHPGEPRWVQQVTIRRTTEELGWTPDHDLETYVREAI